MRNRLWFVAALVAGMGSLGYGQAPAAAAAEPPPVVREHTITIQGKSYSYTSTTGRLPITTAQGEPEAQMFFIAYTLKTETPQAKRPLMISFNGGPGSSSVWLHLGVLGPRMIPMLEDGSYPPPPYQVVDNPHTFLPFTDMVFIDPVGTGYSRAAKGDSGRKFWGVQGDIQSVGEFIRLYLTRYSRWNSPLYLIGESYGTFRAAGLAGYLVEKGIAFNGVALISSILNFQTARFNPGNDLPFALFLPTYTATAWYHKRLPADLQGDLKKALREAEQFVSNEYAVALMKGDRLTAAERQAVVDKLHRLTGISKVYLEQHNLRLEIMSFCKELLRDKGTTVGRLDSRLTGVEGENGAPRIEFDPSMAAIRPPYTAAFNHYVRTELGYSTDLEYYILGGGFAGWDYGSAGSNMYADTSESLRQAFAKNPYMRVFVGSGYYDLATPYYATEYTFSHMGLPAKYKPQITNKYYEAGHMFYIHKPSLAQMTKDIAAFVEEAGKGK